LNKAGFSQIINNWFFKKKEFTIRVMDDHYSPDLRYFIKLVSLLVRGCYQGPNNRGVTPYSLDTSVYGELLELPANWKLLMLGKFGQEILRYFYNLEESELIACHLCFNDPQVSTFFLQNVLEPRTNWKETSNLYHAAVALCKIQDDNHLPDLRLRFVLSNCSWGANETKKQGLFYLLQKIENFSPEKIFYLVKFLEDLCNINSTAFAYIFYRRDECCNLMPVIRGMYIQSIAKTTEEKMAVLRNFIVTKELPPPNNSSNIHFKQLCLYLAMQCVERIYAKFSEHLQESFADQVMGETFEITDMETMLLDTALENARNHIPQIIVPEWIKTAYSSDSVSVLPYVNAGPVSDGGSDSDSDSEIQTPDKLAPSLCDQIVAPNAFDGFTPY